MWNTVVTNALLGWAMVSCLLCFGVQHAAQQGLIKTSLKDWKAWFIVLLWPVAIPVGMVRRNRRRYEISCIREIKNDAGGIQRIARRIILRNGRPIPPLPATVCQGDVVVLSTRPVWDRQDITFWLSYIGADGELLPVTQIDRDVAFDECGKLLKTTRETLFQTPGY